MSPFKILIASVLCAASFGAFAVEATIEGMQACSAIKWNAQFLKDHPRAPAGCQAVTTRDGVKYARFTGEVKSIAAGKATVAMKNVAGTEGTKIEVDTTGESMVTINGKEMKAADLKPGDSLNFYVKEGDFGASPTTHAMKPAVVTPKPMPSN